MPIRSSVWHLKLTQIASVASSAQALLLYFHLLQIFNNRLLHAQLKSALVWSRISELGTRRLGWLASKSFSKLRVAVNSDLGFPSKRSRRIEQGRAWTSTSLIRSEQDLWSLFAQSWSIMRPKHNLHYTTNRDFKLLFLTASAGAGHSALVSVKGYFKRWVSSYNFLFNLFYADSSAQLLSNKHFIEESLLFNWEYSFKNYKIFRLVQPFFVFSDVNHGGPVKTSVFNTFLQKLDFTVVVDLKNHNTFLKYLRGYNMYMIALVPNSCNPWGFSYPIPAFSDSWLIQLYFLKFLIQVKASSRSRKYASLYSLHN